MITIIGAAAVVLLGFALRFAFHRDSSKRRRSYSYLTPALICALIAFGLTIISTNRSLEVGTRTIESTITPVTASYHETTDTYTIYPDDPAVPSFSVHESDVRLHLTGDVSHYITDYYDVPLWVSIIPITTPSLDDLYVNPLDLYISETMPVRPATG